jgi:23S rRNA (guanosine2251-2'-O)-methyltransferase
MKADNECADELIFGKNAVLAFLEAQVEEKDSKQSNSRPIHKIYMGSGFHSDSRMDRVKDLAHKLKIPVAIVDRRKLDELVGKLERHQGIVAQISAAQMLDLDDFLDQLMAEKNSLGADSAKAFMNELTVAIVDGIEDPHNLGAIVRVAESAGLKALLLPMRRAAALTATVAKTSSGALAFLPVVKISNIVQAIERLKEFGFWVTGLDAEGSQIYTEVDLKGPLAVVIGSEGTGISRLVVKNCDFLIRIPMLGKTESLNASVAAGIVFYEIVRQRGKKIDIGIASPNQVRNQK